MGQVKFRKDIITAWLLPIALVLSLLALSEYRTPPATRRVTITEQVLLARVANKQDHSFNINSDPCSLSFPYSAVACFQLALRYYTQIIKIQIKQRDYTPAVMKFLLSPSQHTLRSSDENHILSFVG